MTTFTRNLAWLLAAQTALLVCASPAWPAVRIKDITTIEGVRVNKLSGMGLVTGLNGSGGNSTVTRQFATNFQQKFGVRLDPLQRLDVPNGTRFRTESLSVVTVSAELLSFAKQGNRIDVLVSTFDDAKSLQGGKLETTPLFGLDGRVYAVASGPISIGGFSFQGAAASVQKNHPTTGRIPNGAVVEEEIPSSVPIGQFGRFRLLLHEIDYETARRISDAINASRLAFAAVLDASAVDVRIPVDKWNDVASVIGDVRNLYVEPDAKAKVVINERTGTIIIGRHVRLAQVAITHANLSVINTEAQQVSQPGPFSKTGQTEKVDRSTIDVFEEKNPITVVEEPVTVGDLARALNALGVTPRDLSSIFQHLKEAGALHAELEFR